MMQLPADFRSAVFSSFMTPPQHLDQADGESRGSVDRESGRGAASEPSARGTANLPTARPKGQWPQQGCNVREEELVRELVYVFQGIQGSLITLDSSTGKFSLGRQLKMPDHQRAVVIKLCEIGRLYGEVREFTEKRAGETSYGLVGHSFVTALREELTEYYRLLAGLEASLREGSLTLLQMSVWTREPLARLKLLVLLLRSVGNARGGALASALYGHLDAQGAPVLRQCVASLLSACCRPLYSMLLRWLLDGALEDPHGEFFICGEASVQGEAIWHHKYSVRKAMVPTFLSAQWTSRILSTGKAINFLSSVCGETKAISAGLLNRLESMDPATLYLGELDSPLLGEGDIMRYLLDLLEGELGQPATQLMPHNLAGILETAIRGTNTQYEDPDILGRLDVKLLEIQPGDTGWDVFSLDYKVTGPIGVVFTQDAMTQYLMLFNTLWRAKRMEWVLSGVWQKLASLHKMTRQLKEP